MNNFTARTFYSQANNSLKIKGKVVSKPWQLTSYLYKFFRHCFPFYQILEAENENFRKLLSTLPIQPAVVLDLGTGDGNALRQFQKIVKTTNPANAPQILALDYSANMLKNFKFNQEVDLIQAELGGLPIKDQSVTLIFAIGVTEYVKNLQSVIQEIQRILAPDGQIIVSISPINGFFYLRFLLGKKLFRTFEADLASYLKDAELEIKQKVESLTQILFLAVKKP